MDAAEVFGGAEDALEGSGNRLLIDPPASLKQLDEKSYVCTDCCQGTLKLAEGLTSIVRPMPKSADALKHWTARKPTLSFLSVSRRRPRIAWSSRLVTCLVAVEGFRMLEDFRMQHKAHFPFQPRAFKCSKWSPVLKNVSAAAFRGKAGQA